MESKDETFAKQKIKLLLEELVSQSVEKEQKNRGALVSTLDVIYVGIASTILNGIPKL